MLKIYKKSKLFVVCVLVLSLLAMYGSMNRARAASLTFVSDTLSDSRPGIVADHTVDFTTGVALVATDYIEVVFPGAFGDVGTSTCPANTELSTSTRTIKCTAIGAVGAGALRLSISDIVNPSATTTYNIDIATKNVANAEIESAQIAVAIMTGVTVTASVPATLTFSITGLNPGVDVNGVSTTGTSTYNEISFGTLTVNATSTIGQQLAVATNADNGYSVTVQQSRNLTSDNGADIDAFVDGQGATSSVGLGWTDPSNNINNPDTFGHFGFTSEDASLSGANDFGTALYKGFDNYLTADPVRAIEVMYHNGPSDATSTHIGVTQVAYSVKVTALQEAGDYTNTLTYICTPEF